MKIKCSRCGKNTHKKIDNYRYKESGLDNIYLENIPVYECSCGISYPSIFRLHRLNELIALTLVEKPALLSGNEIKFLRKNLHVPSKLFANKLGVGKTTLSKWENEAQPHNEAFDRLIRATYMIAKNVKHQVQVAIINLLENIRLKDSENNYVIIAEKVEDDYVVSLRLVVESKAKKIPSIFVSSGGEYWTATSWEALVGDETHTKSDLQFASQKVLSTKTSLFFDIKEVSQDAT